MAFAKCSKSMYPSESDDFCSFASNMIEEYDYIFYVSPEGVDIDVESLAELEALQQEMFDGK